MFVYLSVQKRTKSLFHHPHIGHISLFSWSWFIGPGLEPRTKLLPDHFREFKSPINWPQVQAMTYIEKACGPKPVTEYPGWECVYWHVCSSLTNYGPPWIRMCLLTWLFFTDQLRNTLDPNVFTDMVGLFLTDNRFYIELLEVVKYYFFIHLNHACRLHKSTCKL